MLPVERRQQILNILRQEGRVTVPDLARRLSTSVDTVRRDLKELEGAHQLSRVHGGALPKSAQNIPYSTRKTENLKTKQQLAQEAVKLLQPNQTIFIDGGSTTLEFAKCIPLDFAATVVTVCPNVLLALSEHPNITLIMPGGTLDRRSMTFVGSATYAALKQVRADIFFLGVCSLHLEFGITAAEFEEAQTKKLMIENSDRVVAITESAKLGTMAPFAVANVYSLTHIVTNNISQEQAKAYTDLGIVVLDTL